MNDEFKWLTLFPPIELQPTQIFDNLCSKKEIKKGEEEIYEK